MGRTLWMAGLLFSCGDPTAAGRLELAGPVSPQPVDCTISYRLGSHGYLEPFAGVTACPRSSDPDVLKVRSAVTSQSHCAEITITFANQPLTSGSLPPTIAWVKYVANGPNTYSTQATDRVLCNRGPEGQVYGPPASQPPLLMEAEHDGQRGTGTVTISSDTRLDAKLTLGNVDVQFPDGTRLFADFEAPLYSSE